MDRLQEGKRIASARKAIRRWIVPLNHQEQRSPTIASVPSGGPYATQSETPKESVAPCPRELTGENSPHLYRGEKTEKPHQQNATFLVFTLLVLLEIEFAAFGWSLLLSSDGGN